MPLINGTIISGVNAKDATAKSTDILQGKTAVVGKELIIGTMPEKAGQTVDGTFDSGTTGYITGKIPQDGHYSANSKLKIPVSNLSAGNIRKGVNIGGVVGTYTSPSYGVTSGTITIIATDKGYGSPGTTVGVQVVNHEGSISGATSFGVNLQGFSDGTSSKNLYWNGCKAFNFSIAKGSLDITITGGYLLYGQQCTHLTSGSTMYPIIITSSSATVTFT